jgi:GT2 family glycosyltransferase/glycosyltransferase involved in cell wall biosynthesis
MSRYRCSIIVPVFNHAAVTRRCLDSLLHQKTSVRSEIVVVDDSSSDATAELLLKYGDAIRVVTRDRNGGFARACNDGAAVATGDDLVFLNNDTIPKPGWLDALVAYADQHPEAAVVGSKLLYPNDTIQHAGLVISQDLYPRHLYSGFPADHPATQKSRPFQAVTAASALIRRAAFEQAGRFDDAFVNGYEDVDLCFRLTERGAEIHYCHESVLYHLEAVTREAESPTNHELYLRRWRHQLRPDELDYYVEDGLLTLRYQQQPPHELEVSPLVALVDAEEHDLAARALINIRSRQVFEVLRENVRLRIAAETDVSKRTSKPKAEPAAPTEKAVLLVSGSPGDTQRYRCDHPAEQLELSGITTEVETYPSTVLDDGAARFGCIILHRVSFDDRVAAFVEDARQRGKPVLFDTDDLLFDREVVEHLSGFASMRASDRAQVPNTVRLQRETLVACDAVLVSTEPLREAASRFHSRVFVRPNTVSMEMVVQADAALARKHVEDRAGEGVRLGYFSGTPTHDEDFLVAADAVLSLLERVDDVRLMTVGPIRLDRRFTRFRERIEQVPFQPWWRLPELLGSVDVNLAPLEVGNPFAAAKSCVKYLEAGLLGVPTVASPRPDFTRVIAHGTNGLLAETRQDWEDALGELVRSPARRREIGRAAFDDVRAHHTTQAAGPSLAELLDAVARQVRDVSARGDQRRIPVGVET